MIAIDRNTAYTPCCFIVCRVNPIDGDYSTRDEGGTVLVQSDWDWPTVAEQFGWHRPDGTTPEEAIPLAGAYLETVRGKVVDDPGYFL